MLTSEVRPAEMAKTEHSRITGPTQRKGGRPHALPAEMVEADAWFARAEPLTLGQIAPTA